MENGFIATETKAKNAAYGQAEDTEAKTTDPLGGLRFLDNADLETKRLEIAGAIEALPGAFTVNGTGFSWRERFQYLAIIVETNMITYSINLDGSIKSYSFGSASGDGNGDAEKTIRLYQTAIHLLSDDFRQAVIADYRSKKPALDALKAEYAQITREIDRRETEKRDAEKAAREAGRAAHEEEGAVWHNLSGLGTHRYTVKSVSAKTILFAFWRYDEKTRTWLSCPEGDRRISKDLLNEKRRNIHMRPVGATDIQSQKPEKPQTLDY